MKLKHLLTGEELMQPEIKTIIAKAIRLKQLRAFKKHQPPLAGYHLALIFDKPSLRTRISFTVGMRELGGEVIESIETTRKIEDPEDQARVLAGYCQGIMIRTHEDTILERMRNVATIPIINGLSNLHHPCQILADLLTLYETFGDLNNIVLSYIGDGNNILHSLLLLAPQLGVRIHYCCPPHRGPHPEILKRSLAKIANSNKGNIQAFTVPKHAVTNAHVVYTDVWTSMGFENHAAEHLFAGFQVNEALMKHAQPQAVFMHCLPMERGKEVSKTLPDHSCSIIFQQSENRLHIQKALLLHCLTEHHND